MHSAVVVDRAAQQLPDDVEYYVYGADGRRLRKVFAGMAATGGGVA